MSKIAEDKHVSAGLSETELKAILSRLENESDRLYLSMFGRHMPSLNKNKISLNDFFRFLLTLDSMYKSNPFEASTQVSKSIQKRHVREMILEK